MESTNCNSQTLSVDTTNPATVHQLEAREQIWVDLLVREAVIGDVVACLSLSRALKKDEVCIGKKTGAIYFCTVIPVSCAVAALRA